MIQAILIVCVPLFVALVGHSAYRVRKANREHEARIDGVPAPADRRPVSESSRGVVVPRDRGYCDGAVPSEWRT